MDRARLQRMYELAEGIAVADWTPEQQQERDQLAKKLKQNPRVAGPDYGGEFTIAFKTFNRDSEPLWWTGDGFKNLARARGEPQGFKSKGEAEAFIRAEVLPFIKKWRADEQHLVIGWP